jgi:hypothetical protein
MGAGAVAELEAQTRHGCLPGLHLTCFIIKWTTKPGRCAARVSRRHTLDGCRRARDGWVRMPTWVSYSAVSRFQALWFLKVRRAPGIGAVILRRSSRSTRLSFTEGCGSTRAFMSASSHACVLLSKDVTSACRRCPRHSSLSNLQTSFEQDQANVFQLHTTVKLNCLYQTH